MTAKRFNAHYLMYYIAMGVYFPFIGLYFEKELGFTGKQIGTILGMGPIIMMFSLPLFGMISDKLKRPKLIILLLIIMASILSFSIQYYNSFTRVLLVILFFELFKGPIGHLNDSITIKLTDKYNLNYSGIRTWGSIGFVVGSVVIGFVVRNTGFSSIFPFVTLFLILSGSFVLSYPIVEYEKESIKLTTDLPSLVRNKNYICIVLIACLTFVMSDVQNAYNGIFISSLGGSVKQVGYATIFTVFFELVLMKYNKKLLNRFGIKKVLLTAVLALFLRYIISYFSVNIWMFYIAISMHGLSVALVLPTVLVYMYSIVPKKMNATAITIYGSIAAMISATLYYIIGFIYDEFNLRSTFLIVASLLLFVVPLIINLNKDVKYE